MREMSRQEGRRLATASMPTRSTRAWADTEGVEEQEARAVALVALGNSGVATSRSTGLPGSSLLPTTAARRHPAMARPGEGMLAPMLLLTRWRVGD